MYNVFPESSYELVGTENIKHYLLGGKAIVTLQSPTGVYHTYAVNKPRNPGSFPDGTYFIFCQTHNGVWLYCGMLIHYTEFKLTYASKWGNDSEIVKGARYIVDMMNGHITSTPMKLYHAGVCCVCGRKLISPKSIVAGIGPKCKKNYGSN